LAFKGGERDEIRLEYLQLAEPESSDEEGEAVPSCGVRPLRGHPKLMAVRVYCGPRMLSLSEVRRFAGRAEQDDKKETA